MYSSRSNPTPVFKPPLEKHEGYKERKNGLNYISVIKLLNFLTNSTPHEAQFTVHQFVRFGTDPRPPHDKAVKNVLKHLKGTAMQ